MGQLPFIPTRFHLCSIELEALEGDAREDEMRACLNARFRAEKTVRSQCAEQVKQLRPAPRNGDERYRAQRDCFIQHLTLSYKDLLHTAEHDSAALPKRAKTMPASASPLSKTNGNNPAPSSRDGTNSADSPATAQPAAPAAETAL